MISVYNIKPGFQNLLRPLLGSLVKAGVTANHLTLVAIMGSVCVGWITALCYDNPAVLFVIPLWLFVRMALNALDGMAAREHNMASKLGAVLNEVGDVVSDAVLYLPLALFSPRSLWPIVLFTIGSVLNEFCGVLGQALKGKRHYEGPMGKSDRALFVGALTLVTGLIPQVTAAWPSLFLVAFVLELYSCVNRLVGFLRD